LRGAGRSCFRGDVGLLEMYQEEPRGCKKSCWAPSRPMKHCSIHHSYSGTLNRG